jgi:transcriptional regulator with XRE-family HTH domain
MATTFTEQLRAAVRDGGMSRYRLAKRTGIDESLLSRFVRGKTGLSLGTVDKLVEELGLELRPKGRGMDRG